MEKKYEEEVKAFKDLFKFPMDAGLLYLRFIHEKGLLDEFTRWRAKKLLKAIGLPE